jgi:hypothetical protein
MILVYMRIKWNQTPPILERKVLEEKIKIFPNNLLEPSWF